MRYVSQLVEYAESRLRCVRDDLLVRDVFMILLMIATFVRPSEAMAIKSDQIVNEDMTLDDGSTVRALGVYIEKSKTDQVRNGHSIVVPRAPTIACAVLWYERWCIVRIPSSRYLFHDLKTGAKLSGSTPNSRVKARLREAGVPNPETYTGASTRPSGATEASRSGIGIRLLKRHGNWKSDAVYIYVHDSLEQRLTVGAAALPKLPLPVRNP
jgi:integrase